MKEMCARTVNGSAKLSYLCSDTLIFLECSSILNAAHVTNAFVSYTWLRECFFLMFSFYALTTFLFYRLFDNVLMKMYSLCGRYRDKKVFKETKICGVIASSFLQSQKMNWVLYLPFRRVCMHGSRAWSLKNLNARQLYFQRDCRAQNMKKCTAVRFSQG